MSITLTKDMGAADLVGMTKLEVGVSWDTSGGSSRKPLAALKRRVGTDIDLIAIAMSGPDPVRYAGLDQLDPLKNGSLVHSGDNQTGRGEGDDELVTVDLLKVPDNVTAIVFVAVAYKPGSDLAKAANVSFKVYDSSDGKQTQVADIWPSLLNTGNACAVAKVYREGSIWKMEVVNEMGRVTQGDQGSLLRFAVNR